LLLEQNRLTSLEGVAALTQLHMLNVRHNNITSISALKATDVPRLQKLVIADNRISLIKEIEELRDFYFLVDLAVQPNPLGQLPHFRAQVAHRLQHLRSLDGHVVPAEDKVKADIIYGADINARKEVFEQLLPRETFVDRRLVTEEGIEESELRQFGKCGDAGPFGLLPEATKENNSLGVRSSLQMALFQQRLAKARYGGVPAGVADFEDIAAPFMMVGVTDNDLPAILEAVAEGGVDELKFGAAALSEAGVAEVLAFMAELSRPLHVDLAGCKSVAALEDHLSRLFPYEQGSSLEAADCGLPTSLEIRLRNGSKAAEARQLAAEARRLNAQRVAAYMAKQSALEEFAADHRNADQPPPLRLPLCHPARWQEGDCQAAETEYKAFKTMNPEGLRREETTEDSEEQYDMEQPLVKWTIIQKDGSSLRLGMDEYRALDRQKDDMLKDWGYDWRARSEAKSVAELPEQRELPLAFETTFREVSQSIDLLGFMMWVGLTPNPDVVEEERHQRVEREQDQERERQRVQREESDRQHAYWQHQRESWEKEWRETQRKLGALSELACRTYETEPQQAHRGSGQIIAHFTFICLGSRLQGNDPVMPHTHFGLKRIPEQPRPKPRKGIDIHLALASGTVAIQSATGTGLGPDALLLVLSNKTNKDAEVAIPRGTIFQHVDWQHRQNLMVSIDYVLKVRAGELLSKPMSAYCMNLSCACSRGNPLALTDFYFDDAEGLKDQGNVWDHFERCFSKML